MARTAKRTTRKAPTRKKPAGTGKPRKVAARRGQPARRPAVEKRPIVISGRVAAPAVRLGMTPPEVRATTGQPECILFGSDDHVEWQFGARGLDAVGAPTLYVTALTFASGRVVRITERMSEIH